jgi:SAM-dependent methyltransferase
VTSEQVYRLHLGCGINTPDGWINLDGAWNAWLAKHQIVCRMLKGLHALPVSLRDMRPDIIIHDVRKPLPFQDNSIHAIYASHLLEHLYLEEAKRLLKECFRILQPGGILRMVVPDLRAIILEYMGEKILSNSSDNMKAASPADRLNRRLAFRVSDPSANGILYRIYNSIKDFHSHKWMYVIMYFEQADFVDVQQLGFHQSLIEGIEEIEESERVLDGAGVCIEGIKPE